MLSCNVKRSRFEITAGAVAGAIVEVGRLGAGRLGTAACVGAGDGSDWATVWIGGCSIGASLIGELSSEVGTFSTAGVWSFADRSVLVRVMVVGEATEARMAASSLFNSWFSRRMLSLSSVTSTREVLASDGWPGIVRANSRLAASI